METTIPMHGARTAPHQEPVTIDTYNDELAVKLARLLTAMHQWDVLASDLCEYGPVMSTQLDTIASMYRHAETLVRAYIYVLELDIELKSPWWLAYAHPIETF